MNVVRVAPETMRGSSQALVVNVNQQTKKNESQVGLRTYLHYLRVYVKVQRALSLAVVVVVVVDLPGSTY